MNRSRTTTSDSTFRRTVLNYWRRHGRHDLPWRARTTPYRTLVSELMLQQTQVPRVVPKFKAFTRTFPSFGVLANSGVASVLAAWQGLGYNRRALMLRRCAKAVIELHGGVLPDDYQSLVTLPGIGPYTAGAVLAFAFDRPVAIIETNIRRVYLHHFFSRRRKVSDSKILPIVIRHTLLVRSPRDWYSALMDYGTHLASTVVNPNRRSLHHVRQSRFEGSARQVRGRILKVLLKEGPMTQARLASAVGQDTRLGNILTGLVREGFIHLSTAGNRYSVVQ